ncbi:MAG: PorT family protein [Dysgonamonadaceae bacterium]|jgi:hypothetical protein|nr:PorT family protein [Dysgonamonadaceae bacterium]
MKKITLSIVTLSFLAMQVFAQETAVKESDLSGKSFRFGLKQGLNISKINTNAEDEFLSRLDYCVGVTFELSITKWLSIQPEILFSPKGYHYETPEMDPELSWIVPLVSASEEDFTTKYTYNLAYGEIPVNLVIKTPAGFNFGAGVYLACMLDGKAEWALHHNGHRINEDYIVKHKSNSFYNIIPRYGDNPYRDGSDYSDLHNLNKYRGERELYYSFYSNLLEEENKVFNSFDWGLNFMVEYQMPFGLAIGVSYAGGMNNILAGLPAESGDFIKNTNLNIYLGVKF